MSLLENGSKLLANRSGARTVFFVTICAGILANWTVAAAEQRTGAADQRNVVVKEFHDRVNDYMALHRKMAAAVPPLTPTAQPEKIEVAKNSLAIAIRGARRTARRGDIFGSAAEVFRQSIREDSRYRSNGDVHAALKEVPKLVQPAVNADYPEKAPVATVPPLLLLEFPPLPEGLEYRFMGRSLILYDTKANLIVDFIHEAIPRPMKHK